MRLDQVFLLTCCALALAAQTADFPALAAQANQARESDRLDDAILLYRKALALRPAWAEGWWYLGTLLYDRDDYTEAAGGLQKAVELSPQTGNAVAMLGLCEAKLGRDRDALEHLQKGRALGVAGDQSLRRVMLYTQGTLLLRVGEFNKAQKTLDLLAREGADQEELLDALGESVLGIRPEDMTSADSAKREVVRRAGQAEHAAAGGDVHAALAEYSQLAASAPKFHNVQFAYGRFLLANHFDDQAVAAFRREIENSPQHLLARLGIAGVMVETDPAAGLPYAEQAVQLAPELAEAHFLLGSLWLATGAVDKAIVELETAEHQDPGDPRVYFALGNAYAAVHRMEDAARARAEFARLSMENPK
ncbi:MAG TPA: tetratricopeptide repeat protein [Bryobacteraceae bacterium]|nr:tetratricopeptide repeat protein [Bryobacteraceae bacterium]